MKKEKIIGICLILGALIAFVLVFFVFNKKSNNETGINSKLEVNISTLILTKDNQTSTVKKYTINDYESFINDYEKGNLPEIYVTEFLFDGVSTYKTYDLDDFIEGGNDITVEPLKITVFNVNTTGNISFVGEIKGGMIAVNTNDISDDINIILNGVKIDTDSKKAPAIYVYNKDITYTKHKVTIVPADGTKNYIEGGKLKKVSLIGSDELNNYSNYYSGEIKNYFEEYSNYYGIYTKNDINKILFAKVTADREDLQDGDPYYYYKASGAISSDIDLYFEGKGYLEVTSKNKEGIETKGNLTFAGGTGDYSITSQDDCLNTTTDKSENSNARNTLTIDVNSLKAIVSLEADEGDAIDSNGELIINGGTIIALARPGQDAGIDSETGTYINGGTVLATGNMYDEVKSSSKQNFVVLSFGSNVDEGTLITLLNEKGNNIFGYETDRKFTYLIYSSPSLVDGTYNLYSGGIISGTNDNGLYTTITNYNKGVQLGYTSKGNNMGGQGRGMQQFNEGERPEMPNGEIQQFNEGERPEMPNEEMQQFNKGERPEMPNGGMQQFNEGERPEMPNGGQGMMPNNMMEITSATNKDFVISGISNIFSGVALFSE